MIKSRESAPVENTAPSTRKNKKRSSLTTAANKRAPKRKAPDSSDDELLMDITSSAADTSARTDNDTTNEDLDDMELSINNTIKGRTSSTNSNQTIVGPITDYDRIITSTMDVADHYMQVADENCRNNAVFFTSRCLSHVVYLGDEVCNALKTTFAKRIRDKKPMIRAQAVIASQTFQDHKSIQDAFSYHFQWDPELCVRKALFQVMKPEVFGYDFLVASTRDSHESIRKDAFKRLGSLSPSVLSSSQLHRVIHNGLNERERKASYAFKTYTLEQWYKSLYDGLDLHKLLESFDLLNYSEDISRLLNIIYAENLEQFQNNGTTTKLHIVVETFRDRWLNCDNLCLPTLNQIDEKLILIWTTLVKFCRENQSSIQKIRVRDVVKQTDDPDVTLEKILDSQEQQDSNDDIIDLYERLTPDLVNLIGFLRRFVQHTGTILKEDNSNKAKYEFIYQRIMQFTLSYEIGDDAECKEVKEVLTHMLKENLLTQFFENYIPPIIKSLRTFFYSKNANLLINYISDSINNVRSHLEDLATSSQAQFNTPAKHSRISKPEPVMTRSVKKVRISENEQTKRVSFLPDSEQQNIEYKMATMRVEIEELKDQLDNCVKARDYDQAKVINGQLSDLTAELASLRDRRRSIASDVSQMSMVIDSDPTKFSSTMLGDTSMDDSIASCATNKEDLNIFKNHPNELIKCLQMYYSCLQNVQVSEVPPTMRNHLKYLSYECLECFRESGRMRSLMVSCHGLTAVMDKNYSKEPSTIAIILSTCNDPVSIEVRTSGFRSLVDVLCQYEDAEIPMNRVDQLFSASLREYGKYDPENMKKDELAFITAVIEGAAKLYYFKRLSSPKILSHLILWWYHPRTHSKLKQFIGVYLPMLVADHMREQKQKQLKLQQRQQQQVQDKEKENKQDQDKQSEDEHEQQQEQEQEGNQEQEHDQEQPQQSSVEDDTDLEDTWLKDLLKETFLTSVELLHSYILGPGANIMSANDISNLINFLCNLVPRNFHPEIRDRLDDRIDELTTQKQQKVSDLVKYLKQARTHLSPL